MRHQVSRPGDGPLPIPVPQNPSPLRLSHEWSGPGNPPWFPFYSHIPEWPLRIITPFNPSSLLHATQTSNETSTPRPLYLSLMSFPAAHLLVRENILTRALLPPPSSAHLAHCTSPGSFLLCSHEGIGSEDPEGHLGRLLCSYRGCTRQR